MEQSRIKYSLIAIFFVFISNIYSQKDIYDTIIYDITHDKEIKKDLRRIFGKDSKEYLSKNNFRFVVDTIYNCCGKGPILNWFASFVEENYNNIGLSVDSLAVIYSQKQQEKVINPELLRYSTDTSSKIRVHFSQEIKNTITCQIFFYKNYAGYNNDAYFNTAKSNCLSIMYVLEKYSKTVKSRKSFITQTWRNLPTRTLD